MAEPLAAAPASVAAAPAAAGAAPRGLLAAPLLCCGLRPFFLGGALWSGLAILLWIGMLSGLLPMIDAPLAGTVWHAHELVWGFGMAAVTGFLLTSIPEFTASADYPPRDTAVLVTLWMAGRLFGVAGLAVATGAWVWLAAACNLALVGWLAARIVPRLLRQPEHRHLSFAFAVLTLLALEAGFWFELARGGDGLRWVNALLGVMLALIVLSQSRVSTRLLHGLLDRFGVHEHDYRAPPPRRALAIVCIAVVSAAELLGVAAPTLGWLALAAAAAVLALMTDWHFGRALANRWVWPLYAVYLCMVGGFVLLGLAWLGAPWAPSAGRHLLTAGAMGVAVMVVFNIAGRIHAGRQLDDRRWRLVAIALVLAAAGARLAAGIPQLGLLGPLAWWWIASLCWAGAWLLYAGYAWPHLAGARTDGGHGCEEVHEADAPSAVPAVSSGAR